MEGVSRSVKILKLCLFGIHIQMECWISQAHCPSYSAQHIGIKVEQWYRKPTEPSSCFCNSKFHRTKPIQRFKYNSVSPGFREGWNFPDSRWNWGESSWGICWRTSQYHPMAYIGEASSIKSRMQWGEWGGHCSISWKDVIMTSWRGPLWLQD